MPSISGAHKHLNLKNKQCSFEEGGAGGSGGGIGGTTTEEEEEEEEENEVFGVLADISAYRKAMGGNGSSKEGSVVQDGAEGGAAGGAAAGAAAATEAAAGAESSRKGAT